MFGEPTRAFLKDTGVFLQLPGVLCIPTFVVIAVFEEWYALITFCHTDGYQLWTGTTIVQII